MESLDTTTTNSSSCAYCGKEGGNLNTCNKCNMVKYCNAACKKKHRSRHKKACERRVAELHDEALFKEHPPRDDCPICFLPLPLDVGQTFFQSCCGKIICCGCIVANEEARERGKIDLCAFCRVPTPTSDEERVKRKKKLMNNDNAYAFYQLAGDYARGIMGMPQDWSKAYELYLKAGELGCAEAYCNLGFLCYNGEGVDVDKKKGRHYYELAAMNGNLEARHNLGYMEAEASNHHRALKHFILAAKTGYKDSLDNVKVGFMKGVVTKDEYAKTLRAFQSRYDEMKSNDRDKVLALINDGAMGRLVM